MEKKFHELIYCEDKADYDALQRLIAERFPGAKFEDASDDIHEYRFGVEGEGRQDDLYRFAIANRFATQGLWFNLDLRMHTDRIKKLVDEVKAAA